MKAVVDQDRVVLRLLRSVVKSNDRKDMERECRESFAQARTAKKVNPETSELFILRVFPYKAATLFFS